MIKVVDYHPDHLATIELRECHEGERPEKIVGPAITFLIDGEPAAIFGWSFVTGSVVQVWGLLSNRIRERPKSFHRSVREFIAYAFERYHLQRMQFSVRVGFHVGWNWAHALGFRCEGIMRKFGPNGEDYWLFARVIA